MVRDVPSGTQIREHLTKILSELGLTDADLARMTGISKAYLSQLGGVKDPAVGNLCKIADALGMSFEKLLYGVGEVIKLPAPNIYLRLVFRITNPSIVEAAIAGLKAVSAVERQGGDAQSKRRTNQRGIFDIFSRAFLIGDVVRDAGLELSEEEDRMFDFNSKVLRAISRLDANKQEFALQFLEMLTK